MSSPAQNPPLTGTPVTYAVDVPMLVRLERLDETRPLERRLGVPAIEHASGLEDAVDRGRAHSDHVGVEHHERQASVALRRMCVVMGENRLSLHRGEPVVARYQAVVRVHRTVARRPAIELRGGDIQAREHPAHGQLGAVTEAPHEIDDRVAKIWGYPSLFQRSPSFFFSARYSSDTSAMMASFLASRASSAASRARSADAA